ncbi:class I SAM-dependent methyltransferase [Idiomarina seosinensis]|uniref:Class I SAM-dependent methyltransferase n=1 Tax=Idiomarina seosinensis TaxID=281739 RepID=A0A432ZEP4_9GAMM|nr:class I SAM-dependent methyltransferase [Idiomarina seosinensis]RUO75832.1 class I SAM-dependent methyltransferase [Idiomarina seosinensis]
MPAQTTSQAVAKLLQRQPQQPWLFDQQDGHPLLVINPDGQALTDLPAAAWCFHAGHAQHWSVHYCQPEPPALESYQGVLLIVAKEQPLNQYVLQQLLSLAPGRPIWLAGEKRGGVASLVKKLPKGYQAAQKVASGNHCQLYQTSILEPTTAPPLDSYLHSVNVELPDCKLQLQSLPGVFSRERLDAGTELLLTALPAKLPGPITDFACGNGVIAAVLQQRQQPQLTLTDVNPMAIAAAQINLTGANCTFYLNDGLPEELPPQNCIVSNPPFHTGLKTDYSIARQFIQSAYAKLRNKGQLYIVANRFLPWPDAIQQVFGNCQTIADNGKFCVYHAHRK